MKIAHLADLHLSLRQYRENPDGSNQREEDAGRAWEIAVDQVIAAQPDLVLLAGDIYDAKKPRNRWIVALFDSLHRLRAGLRPEAAIVIIAGNHDSSALFESSYILPLMARVPGVHVFCHQPGVVTVGGVRVACMPSAGLRQGVVLEPDPAAEWNVCLAHIALNPAIDGSNNVCISGSHPWVDVGWDYVALGDYHVAHEVTPGVWYSGSLEYVSTNPWGEMQEQRERGLPGKGWLLVELRHEGGPFVQFMPVPTRTFIDFPAIDAADMTPGDIDLLLRMRFEDPATKDAIVRQKVLNCPRSFQGKLDHERIRSYKTRALHFHLDIRRPEATVRPLYQRALIPGRTLTDLMVERMGARALRPEMEPWRPEIVELMRSYMSQVEGAA